MKNILILSSSPNDDGLTAACARAAKAGAEDAGAVCRWISLNEHTLERYRACGDGWGTCRQSHVCCIGDDFDALQRQIAQADALVAVTPVYWGEPSEVHKVFFDRLRRCEATAGEKSRLCGKPVVCVAAAGGGGGGTVTCMAQMERAMQHMRAVIHDRIPITRYSREYQLDAIRAAVRSLAER